MAFPTAIYPGAMGTNHSVVDVIGCAAIGATGAVGAVAGKGATLARTDVGTYTLTFGGVPKILFPGFTVINTDGEVYGIKVQSAVDATGVITFICTDEDDTSGVAAAAELASGSTICWRVAVLSSTATR